RRDFSNDADCANIISPDGSDGYRCVLKSVVNQCESMVGVLKSTVKAPYRDLAYDKSVGDESCYGTVTTAVEAGIHGLQNKARKGSVEAELQQFDHQPTKVVVDFLLMCNCG
nr:hypothetical protein [Tanacetum cinerariifolium]